MVLERKVNYYDGENISDEIISKAKRIVSSSDNGWIFSWDEDVETLDDLCFMHRSYPDEERIILGEDWVISYSDSVDEDEVYIAQWACCETDNKFLQSVEMMKALKGILLDSEGRKISCGMRHDTSYGFYESLLKRGYLEEFSGSIDVDEYLCKSRKLKSIVSDILSRYDSLDDYFLENGYDEFPKRFHKLIFHEVTFGVTDKFVKQYKRD